MAWRARLKHVATAIAAGGGGLALAYPATTAQARAPPTGTVGEKPADGDTLRLVQVVFRHGARTPLSKKYWPALVDRWDVCSLPFDPVPVDVKDENGAPRPENVHNKLQVETVFNGGCHKGELTREGHIQARELGHWLRERYVDALDFLPQSYMDGLVYSRTTNYARTVATLQGVLTGLFPNTRAAIPVHTTEEMDEILFGNAKACQRLNSLIRGIAAKAKAEPLPEDVEQLQQTVQAALGLPATERIDFLDLHDAMTTMLTHGKPIPPGLQDAKLLKQIEEQAAKKFALYVAGISPAALHQDTKHQVLRLGMGRLLKLMLCRMEEAMKEERTLQSEDVSGRGQPRLYLYSGHDSTIMPLLAALGRPTDDHWPGYASNLVFELWERASNGEPYVMVLYNGKDVPLHEVCGGSRCSLKALQEQVLQPYLLSKSQRDEECIVHFSHDLPAGKHVKETATVGSSVSEDDD
jgi:lysophosphatidic acid phosphatase type 6